MLQVAATCCSLQDMREYERLLAQSGASATSTWNPLHGNLLKTGGSAAQSGTSGAQMTAAGLLQVPKSAHAQAQLWGRNGVGHHHLNESSTGQSIGRRYHSKQK